DQSIVHKPVHERFRVVKVRILPCGAVQPEGSTCCFGQGNISSIPETSGRQLWHQSAKLEADPKPLTFCRTVHSRRGRFRSAHSETRITMVSRYDHFPPTFSNRKKSISALAVTTPNSFNKR